MGKWSTLSWRNVGRRPTCADNWTWASASKGQSLLLFEIRPVWNDPSRFMECPVAKATWIKAREVWRVFWHRADGKWHGYQPCPEVKTVEEFLALVDRDENGCFWG